MKNVKKKQTKKKHRKFVNRLAHPTTLYQTQRNCQPSVNVSGLKHYKEVYYRNRNYYSDYMFGIKTARSSVKAEDESGC